MLTKRFITKIHDMFDELNYHETKKPDLDSFASAATKTLAHCKELCDAINTVRMYHFCLKRWKIIEWIFNNELHLFNQYNYEGSSLISVVSDEEALGTYFITNGIRRKINEIYFTSHSFDDEMFSTSLENGRFTMYSDGNYYIKYSRMASDKMKLFNKNDSCLCNIVLSENCGIFLESNRTSYEVITHDDFIGIYDRLYIDGLSDTDMIDTNKLVADIEWDIMKKNSNFGVSKLNVYTENADLEMLLHIACSTFLVFQKCIRAQKRQNRLLLTFGIARHNA